MTLVDYYEVLGISRDATDDDIDNAYLSIAEIGTSPEYFKVVRNARRILLDSERRARHDKLLGHVMVIQSQSSPYLNAMCYQLMKPDQGYVMLLTIKEEFKNFVLKKTGFDWEEAQAEGYGYVLHMNDDAPYLVLRFSLEPELAHFARKLLDARMIR
jgi:curved DNA-binding protein CbpA